MKKPIKLDPIVMQRRYGSTQVSAYSDAIVLRCASANQLDHATLATTEEIDALIDALQKGKAAMIEAQTLKLSDLAYGDIFRFATDGKDLIRKNTGNRSIANWITLFGERIGYPEDPLNASVVRVKVTFEDVTE